jgi:hypothetical protein
MYDPGPAEQKDQLPTSSDETMKQLLQAAALETDSDKLLELFRKITNQQNKILPDGNSKR